MMPGSARLVGSSSSSSFPSNAADLRLLRAQPLSPPASGRGWAAGGKISSGRSSFDRLKSSGGGLSNTPANPDASLSSRFGLKSGNPLLRKAEDGAGGGSGGGGRREGSQPRSKPATSKGWEEKMELRREERQVLGSMLKTEDGEHEAEESTAFNNKPLPLTAPPRPRAGDEKATSFIIPCSWPWWKSWWPAVFTYQSSSNIDRKVDRPMSSVGLSPATAAPRVQETASSSSSAPRVHPHDAAVHPRQHFYASGGGVE